MRHLLIIIFFVFVLSFHAVATDREFIMDCGARQPFSGQKILCHFILLSDEDFVNVEVVKFPEFRGFWSENLAMRQGPMGLLVAPTAKGVRKQVVIGSYSISQMFGRSNAQIIPMKISVKTHSFLGERTQFSEDNAQLMVSQSMPLEMVPLPAIPVSLQSVPFLGNVGEFSISQNESLVEYRINEPATLKIAVEGKGNFPELNSLPLNLPSDSEIVSQHSYFQNLGDITVKTFEYSILFKSLPPTLHPLGSFLFFNSQTRSYQRVQLPTVRFVLAPPLDREPDIQFQLPKPETNWSAASNPIKSKEFWSLQILMALALTMLAFRKHVSQTQSLKQSSAAFLREQRWIRARQAGQQGDSEKAIQLATPIFSELLKDKVNHLKIKLDTYPTQKKLLQIGARILPDDRIKRIAELFKAYDQSFSPTRPNQASQINLETLESDLRDSNKSK